MIGNPLLEIFLLLPSRSIKSLTFQNRITEVQDQTVYGSESNLNHEEGRISGVLGRNRLITNIRVGDQNLYGPGSSFRNIYEESNINTRVGDQNLYGPRSSVRNKYEESNTNTMVGDQNLYGPGPSVRNIYEESNLRSIAMPLGRN